MNMLWFLRNNYLANSAPVIVLCMFLCRGCAERSDEISKLNTTELIRYWGYEAEMHEVTTEDGYILQVHRIVKKGGPPVFFQHGTLGASDCWVLRGPEKDLSFMLADGGYDIWLSNYRGNTYSRKHVNKTTEDPTFWDYSWHEMGYYDLPAVVDHILNTTGYSNLVYIGHSMGSTMFYVLTTTRPEYNDKIALSISLAPTVFIPHLKGLLRPLARFGETIAKISKTFGHVELIDRQNWLMTGCEQKHGVFFCMEFIFLIGGHDFNQLDPETFRRFASHNPSGGSTKVLTHFAQIFQSGEFHMFSYGKRTNLEIYNSELPPKYNLSLITAPVSLHYGPNDLISRPEDVNTLASKLPNLVGNFKVPYKKFNHLDFLWARDIRELLNDDIVSIIENYQPLRILKKKMNGNKSKKSSATVLKKN